MDSAEEYDLHNLTRDVLFMSPMSQFPGMLEQPATRILAKNCKRLTFLTKKYLQEISGEFQVTKSDIDQEEQDLYLMYAPAFAQGLLCPVDMGNIFKSGMPNFISVSLAMNDFGFRPRGIVLHDKKDLAHVYAFCRRSLGKIGERYKLAWFKNLIIKESSKKENSTKLELHMPDGQLFIRELVSSDRKTKAENTFNAFQELFAIIGESDDDDREEGANDDGPRENAEDDEQQRILRSLEDEESRLASQLRTFCSTSGKELRHYLPQTSSILFQLGEIYLKKADMKKGMGQKFDFIRCSALLNGAKVRFKLIKDLTKVSQVDSVLAQLGRRAIVAANGTTNSDDEMLSLSEEFFADVVNMRSGHKRMLDSIPVIPDNAEGDQILKMQKEKVKLVKDITRCTTKEYKGIMTRISNKCVEILGPAPCEFAAVGLGSLAREEITPYSDYEHVLVLKEGIQHIDQYGKIKEYFRWYSVLFQLIMINFGETFIRSVGVKSLNDLYSNDKEKNWFYDDITPCGVASDGTAPQACGTPIGRQELTEKRRHILELIQPAGQMAKFVTSEEHLKNGYYLRELIISTCFVNGSIGVFDDFVSKVEENRKNISTLEETMAEVDMISRNVNANVKYFEMPDSDEYINTKVKMYRPVVTRIGLWGRLLRTREVPSFKILQEMRRLGILNDKLLHEMEFMLAVSCEIRMKTYNDEGHQRHSMRPEELVRHVGKSSLIKFMELLCRLVRRPEGSSISNLNGVDVHSGHVPGDYEVEKLGILIGLQQYREALNEVQRLEKTGLMGEQILTGMYAFCYHFIGKEESNDESLEKCIQYASKVDITDESLHPRRRAALHGFKMHAEALLQRTDDLRKSADLFLNQFGDSNEPNIIKLLMKVREYARYLAPKTTPMRDNPLIDAQIDALREENESTISFYKSLQLSLNTSTMLLQASHVYDAKKQVFNVFSACKTPNSRLSVSERLSILHLVLPLLQDLDCDREAIECMDAVENSDELKSVKRSAFQERTERTFPFYRCESVLMMGDLTAGISMCDSYLSRDAVKATLARDVLVKIMKAKGLAHVSLASEPVADADDKRQHYKLALKSFRGINEGEVYGWDDAYGRTLVNYIYLLVEQRSKFRKEKRITKTVSWLRRAPRSVQRISLLQIQALASKIWHELLPNEYVPTPTQISFMSSKLLIAVDMALQIPT